ncbi:MAG: DUF4365 domain-containing protein [Candidatus Electrothrix sp. AX5]|nr:DUF4365 domain-containing protein [Candidatus Electrothrix sp. AX5]
MVKYKKTNEVERRGVCIAGELFESLGFAFREQAVNDCGIDAHAELIQLEQPTGQLLGIQVKSGPSYLSKKCETGFVFPIDKDHVEYWLNHALPVLVCLCDVEAKNVYWQVVTNETAISTGKGYKFIVPSTQRIDSSSRGPLQQLLTPIIPANRYTIFETGDDSHGAAKRYSFKVVINSSATKAEIATIVRQVTNEGAKRRYYRNHLVEGRWGDSDAHVVSTFIYPTAEDYSRGLWICRSRWIHEGLEKQFRPVEFEGENVGDNIIVDWYEGYEKLSACLSEDTASKEEFFSAILPMMNELKILFQQVETNLLEYNENNINEEIFLARTEEPLKRAHELYLKGIDLPFAAPFECRDVEDKFQAVASSFDNMWIHYAEESRHNWTKENRLYLSLRQCESVRKDLQGFEYELEKIR